jgi:hypothetical protein
VRIKRKTIKSSLYYTKLVKGEEMNLESVVYTVTYSALFLLANITISFLYAKAMKEE